MWKRLTSSLNLRTLASGVKAITAVLAPPRVSQANRVDQTLDEWEDRLVKLGTEYGQELTAKVKVAVLYGMMPKDLQDKVLDECAVNWDETTEAEAGRLFTKIKAQLRNIAKGRREMAGPKPMEVDQIADWREWVGGWYGEHSNQVETEEEHYDEKGGDEAYVQYIGKDGGKKGGKGFQGYCYVCGGFGHSQWDCHKDKGKGKVSARTVGMAKVTARMDTQARGTARERETMARAACEKFALGVGLRSISSRIARRTRTSSEWRRTSQRFSSVGNVQNKRALEDGRRCR